MPGKGIPEFDPARLRTARLAAGMTLAELARASELTDSAVSKYESGSGRPTVRSLAAMASALRVQPGALLDLKALGSGFRSSRLAAGLEQSEVAARMGVAVGMYRALELGLVERLRDFDAASLARVFGVSVDQVRSAHRWDLDDRRGSSP